MSSSSNTTTNVINPKPCNYNCGTRIYWNTGSSEYWEVFTKKKHICPNRFNNNTTAATTTNKPTYYNKKPFAGPKPKMSNSLELLTGPITEIQKKYEILSDIVITEYNGKVHDSQRDRDPKTSLIDLLVYYEVPEGQRDEVKRKFENLVRNQVALHRNY
ncbi:MAG TPA: hypothetical protein VHJ38_08510 [Nitrososphaeraceae archaeon]|nr:hypothetical protein [Nitrososphaeraceae archaeon]